MKQPVFAVIEAPSSLGVGPTGVEFLPEALERAGLLEGLNARVVRRVDPLPDRAQRDSETLLLNPLAIRHFSLGLADAVADVRVRGMLPVVLGGDCNILLGCMLSLRRVGRYGLLFLDGHADFYHPEASPTGAVSDMDLALVTGRGPGVLADLDGMRPLVRDEDVFVFGYRDAAESGAFGSQDVKNSLPHVLDLDDVRNVGVAAAAARAVKRLRAPELAGIWVHLDADVLDDAIMPAVDFRLPGGLSLGELSHVLRVAMRTGKMAGIDITVYNPHLDADACAGKRLVEAVVNGLVANAELRG